jgi:hypothetical protein
MMRTNTSLHADQARRHVGQPYLDLATRPLLAQRNCTALIETYEFLPISMPMTATALLRL